MRSRQHLLVFSCCLALLAAAVALPLSATPSEVVAKAEELRSLRHRGEIAVCWSETRGNRGALARWIQGVSGFPEDVLIVDFSTAAHWYVKFHLGMFFLNALCFWPLAFTGLLLVDHTTRRKAVRSGVPGSAKAPTDHAWLRQCEFIVGILIVTLCLYSVCYGLFRQSTRPLCGYVFVPPNWLLGVVFYPAMRLEFRLRGETHWSIELPLLKETLGDTSDSALKAESEAPKD